MASYAIYVITSALKTDANHLMAMIASEPPSSENMSVGLSASGEAPASHWCGGRPVDTAWLAIYQDLANNLPAPAGGWPWVYEAQTVLTEEQALAAAAALYLNVNTGENAEALPAQNMTTVLTALGLERVVIEL